MYLKMNKAQIKFFIFIVMISTIGQMAAEVYVPSLPYIVKDFKVSDGLVQLSISFFLLGMGASAIFFGYISDFVGRRKVLIISSIISSVGTAICCVSYNITWLIIGRLLQGVGFSGVWGMGSAIVRDRFEGVEYAKYMSYLGIAFALSIDIAPFMGGFLQEWFGWRAIFILILCYNLLIIYTACVYKETFLRVNNIVSRADFLKKILILFKNKEFVVYMIVYAIVYSIFMSYIAVASFIVQDILGKSPIWFGSMTLCLSVVFAIFSYCNGKLLNYLSIKNTMVLGFILIVISAILLLIIAISQLTIVSFLVAIIPMFIGSSFVFANVNALCFSTINENIGVASAVNNTNRLIVAFFIVSVLSKFSATNTVVLGVIFLCLSLLSLLILHQSSNKHL